MVYLPKWVMYKDNLHKVSRRVKHNLYLYPYHMTYPMGWQDPRGVFCKYDFEAREMIVPANQCKPITDEVADIMRAV
jgi:hypothetical protein